MSMTNEFAPPIRDLPDEIEAAIEQTLIAHDFTSERLALASLRHAIRTALDDQDAALRERCERLRSKLVDTYGDIYGSIDGIEQMEDLQPGDLADNLQPRGGDER